MEWIWNKIKDGKNIKVGYKDLYNDNDLESLQMKCEKDILYIISNDVSSNKLTIRNLNFLLTKISYLTHLTPSDTKDVIEKINVKLEELKLYKKYLSMSTMFYYSNNKIPKTKLKKSNSNLIIQQGQHFQDNINIKRDSLKTISFWCG